VGGWAFWIDCERPLCIRIRAAAGELNVSWAQLPAGEMAKDAVAANGTTRRSEGWLDGEA